MQNRKPHSQKAPQTGHSIFGGNSFYLRAGLAGKSGNRAVRCTAQKTSGLGKGRHKVPRHARKGAGRCN